MGLSALSGCILTAFDKRFTMWDNVDMDSLGLENICFRVEKEVKEANDEVGVVKQHDFNFSDIDSWELGKVIAHQRNCRRSMEVWC